MLKVDVFSSKLSVPKFLGVVSICTDGFLKYTKNNGIHLNLLLAASLDKIQADNPHY